MCHKRTIIKRIKMTKFEILFSDETIAELQMGKETHEKNCGGVYISWEQFLKTCILDATYRLVAEGRGLAPRMIKKG